MKRYFGYIRVSTQKQGEKGVSLQEQRDAIESYARQERLEIVEWVEERITAAKRGRPAFNRMLTGIRRGRADGFIIHKIDRSARNLRDWAAIGELLESGGDVRIATDNLDLHTRGGRLTADIQAVIAADYIRNLRDETRKGMYGRLKQGLYPFAAPLGYLDQGGGNAKIPDPKRAHLVQLAFKLYATGRYSYHSLKDELTARGLTRKTGRSISVGEISYMFSNPFYAGIIRLRTTGETFVGSHEPLIAMSLYNRVQSVLGNNSNDRVNRHAFLFRRLLRCGECGYTLIGEIQKNRVYYRCHTKHCSATSIREDAADNVFKQLFLETQLTPEELLEVRALLPKSEAEWEAHERDLIEGLKLQLAQYESRLERLTDALVDGLLDQEAFSLRQKKLAMQITGASQKMLRLEEKAESVRSHVEKYLELLNRLGSSYSDAPRLEKRDLIQTVTSNRRLYSKKLEVTLFEPFERIKNRPRVQNGAHLPNVPRTLLAHLIACAEAEER